MNKGWFYEVMLDLEWFANENEMPKTARELRKILPKIAEEMTALEDLKGGVRISFNGTPV
ncbi:hypothetical protein PVV74_19060 [Roseovarius sp. SK2]|uniref:hypothetical protein n=1 Tax=Roseovarius TaxID=74030 RepID=UPI00237B0F86|nr:hypothetical protein [Roseovarius sp. SK2]MDD9727560.1 hypothetical protein [Roseovarius sp. SK2]